MQGFRVTNIALCRKCWSRQASLGVITAGKRTSRWTAPNSIDHICRSSGFSGRQPIAKALRFTNGEVQTTPAQALTDLGVNGNSTQSCQLQQVNWVIPDGSWSDHPGGVSKDGGPSWVAAIVNAIGGYDNSGNKLPVQCNYWANTVILLVWDDWGGFYDDVNPIATIGEGKPGYVGAAGNNGQHYVYGFRVPLISDITVRQASLYFRTAFESHVPQLLLQ